MYLLNVSLLGGEGDGTVAIDACCVSAACPVRKVLQTRPGTAGGDPGCLDRAFVGLMNPLRNKAMSHVAATEDARLTPGDAAVVKALGARSIVLVGMMGAGKSSIGRRLAARLGLTFIDADSEIEERAGMTISELFEMHGEAYFRAGEARVLARLLDGGPQVLATGGGAFMNANTRTLIGVKGISVWLKAEFDLLLRRIKRRDDRPLLQTNDPAARLKELIEERYPTYAQADLTVHSREVPHETIVEEIIIALIGKFELPRPSAS
jgi:shikimate kinase